MASPQSSPLTTHVLNVSDGVPCARLALSLHRLDPRMMVWTMITVGTTDEDGRCPGLMGQEVFSAGLYKLRFETGPYWEGRGLKSFYPYVEVVFSISERAQTYHLPLLVSPCSYSTYRGS